MNIKELIRAIRLAHEQTQKYALKQVNYSLTLRNWVIGAYIVEFEQKGTDKARYGDKLLFSISKLLKKRNIKGMDERSLRLYRAFYIYYPQFRGAVSSKLMAMESEIPAIRGTVSPEFKTRKTRDQKPLSIPVSARPKTISSKAKGGPAKPLKRNESIESLPAELLLSRLSFSHFIELLNADSEMKRLFYEVQTVKNNWSVRELRRSMETLLYERTGLSGRKANAIKKLKEDQNWDATDVIKSPYVLEFLGLEQKTEITENDLEQSIINHLQKFLIEMGRGFCFEARQKRITFDNKHHYIDLVFYHRILKCHVLIDLKIGAFDHADAGQMNLYLNYFKEEEQTENDNPPIGIILCAHKNDTLVKYATGGLSKKIFVGKYRIQFPSEDELKKLIESDIKALGKRRKN